MNRNKGVMMKINTNTLQKSKGQGTVRVIGQKRKLNLRNEMNGFLSGVEKLSRF